MPIVLEAPNIQIDGQRLYSDDFLDIYFNDYQAIEEVNWVFIQGNDLPSRWRALKKNGHFTIGETGFGAGLNFFTTLNLWQKQRYPHQRLHYISVEKHPIPLHKLLVFYEQWPELKVYADQVSQDFPPLWQGHHLISLPNWGVDLHLIFDQADAGLSALNAKVDAWYLDGFAPSKNPSMWAKPLFKQIARLSHARTSIASFTVAGKVRRGLEEVGFKLSKSKGFAKKREMITGTYDTENITPIRPQKCGVHQAPWFFPPPSKPIDLKHERALRIAIIGGGLAGTAIAQRLSSLGASIALFDMQKKIANGASGNPQGILFFKPGTENNPHNQFFEQAYVRAQQNLIEANTINSCWFPTGVIQLKHNDQEHLYQQKVRNSTHWDPNWLEFITAAELNQQAGLNFVNFHTDAILLPKSGIFLPKQWCAARLEMANKYAKHPINIHLDRKIIQVKSKNNQWYLIPEKGDQIGAFDHVVLASSTDINDLLPGLSLPIRKIRGQISEVVPPSEFSGLKKVLCFDGYITPALNCNSATDSNARICLGATFDPRDPSSDISDKDHAANINKLMQALKMAGTCKKSDSTFDQIKTKLDSHVLGGRAGHRAQLPDYLPLIGPIPDIKFFLSEYQALRKGALKQQLPIAKYMPGLWVCGGFGAKGGTLSTLAADIIAHYILDTPAPIQASLLNLVHPARFIIRDIKRNKR